RPSSQTALRPARRLSFRASAMLLTPREMPFSAISRGVSLYHSKMVDLHCSEKKEPKVAHIIALFICPNAGQPMQYVTSVEAVKGAGLVGDRYAGNRGAYSHPKPKKIRHVTFIASDRIEMANIELKIQGLAPFKPSETRRNIITSGIELNGLVGKEFSVGPVRMRGVELADPCHRPSALAKKKGFKEAFAGRGGLRAEVLSDGIINIGDDIRAM
ncbi:MAG: MOSC domain-containing protein, partial [Minisyncoccia bacterium]